MQELEKILEEIDAHSIEFEMFGVSDDYISVGWVKEIIRKHMNDGWIPVEERLPEDDHYILLSFTNFNLPMIGRYETDQEGGAFYLGDCDEEDTCISQDLFVNAWRPLPKPYRPEKEEG